MIFNGTVLYQWILINAQFCSFKCRRKQSNRCVYVCSNTDKAFGNMFIAFLQKNSTQCCTEDWRMAIRWMKLGCFDYSLLLYCSLTTINPDLHHQKGKNNFAFILYVSSYHKVMQIVIRAGLMPSTRESWPMICVFLAGEINCINFIKNSNKQKSSKHYIWTPLTSWPKWSDAQLHLG